MVEGQTTISNDLLFRIADTLRLTHIYALKDSHAEELPDDFKPDKWEGHEIEYALDASNQYRELLNEMEDANTPVFDLSKGEIEEILGDPEDA